MEPVRSPRNARVAAAVRLRRAKDRRRDGATLLEGPNLLAVAVANGASIRRVFALENDNVTSRLAQSTGFDITLVTREVLDRLAPTQHPRGPVAVVAIPPSLPIVDRHLVVLSGLGDPGNAGTLIRSAAAFGFGVVQGPGTVDVWNPKTMRAAAGSHFVTPIEWGGVELASLRERGYAIVGSVVAGGAPLRSLATDRPLAILVGDEAHGLDENLDLDLAVTIPMRPGVESLNAAVAASIMMQRVSEMAGGSRTSGD